MLQLTHCSATMTKMHLPRSQQPEGPSDSYKVSILAFLFLVNFSSQTPHSINLTSPHRLSSHPLVITPKTRQYAWRCQRCEDLFPLPKSQINVIQKCLKSVAPKPSVSLSPSSKIEETHKLSKLWRVKQPDHNPLPLTSQERS